MHVHPSIYLFIYLSIDKMLTHEIRVFELQSETNFKCVILVAFGATKVAA